MKGSPPATIPQCCGPHRLAALESIETLFVNDALSSFDKMLQSGWPADAALAALRDTYRAWVLGRMGDAIDLGLELLDAEVVA